MDPRARHQPDWKPPDHGEVEAKGEAHEPEALRGRMAAEGVEPVLDREQRVGDAIAREVLLGVVLEMDARHGERRAAADGMPEHLVHRRDEEVGGAVALHEDAAAAGGDHVRLEIDRLTPATEM